jgi:hypothetical protein
MPGALAKPSRTTAVGRKELIQKEEEPVKEKPKQRATVKRVEEEQEDIEIEIE